VVALRRDVVVPERRLVSMHEFGRTRYTGQRNARTTATTKIIPRLTVAVDEAVKVAELKYCH
jgi:hypothetical protein